MKNLFSNYFPTPKYLNMDSCSFDISDESIKYGQLSHTSSGYKLVKLGKEKIPEGVVVSGKIENPKKLIEILKKIKIKENINFARVSLPEEQMYTFILSLPQMNGEDLREMIYLQIEEHIPLKADEVVFDYDTIFEDEKSSTVEVSAAPVELVELYIKVFKDSGILPLSFEIEAQAIARSVIKKGEKGTVMIVDFGYNRTGVSISYNGNVLFTTTLDIGGLDLTEMLIKNFSLSYKEAEDMKRSYGISTTAKVNDIFPIILNGISVLRDELNKQYEYWKTHNEKSGFIHQEIGKIILCGGNANLSGLAEYLESSMKIKVEYANAWINIFDIEMNVPELSFEESLSYVTVLGLSLGGFSYEEGSIINVLPVSEKKKIRSKYWTRMITIFSNIFSLFGLCVFLLLIPSYLLSVSKENLAENKLEEFNLKNPIETNFDMDKTIDRMNSNLKILAGKDLNPEISDRVFGFILRNKPQGVTFSQILYKKRTDGSLMLDIHGIASNRSILRDFKIVLDSNPDYKEVNIPISDFLEKEDLNFTISIILK